ncbi:glycosyltransferase [Novosphingobium lentum]|uniref:glycosyltransferase n=1 Tax=Novosphingobium lentum TaxID=145287 RepID=UPI000834A5B2|nr:glycosyltransferase [Novosphingobium lentum]
MSPVALQPCHNAGQGYPTSRAQAIPPAPSRELLVDMSVIAQFDAGTGIQRAARAILSELSRLRIDDMVVRPVAASAATDYRYLPDGFFQRATREFDLGAFERVKGSEGDVFLGLDLASAIMPRHEAQLAQWRASGVSIHVLVPDMLPLLHGKWFRRPARRHFRRWIQLLERQADQVICHSMEVARSFENWNQRRWRLGGTRILPTAIIPLSGDVSASQPSRGIPADADRIMAWIGRRTTVLMVGTVEPRKGYDQALAAFERLWWEFGDAAPALLVVGRPGWKTKSLQRRMRQRASLEGPFLWLDDVSDEFLEMIYSKVHGLLFASRGEGYGLPVVEAQAYGLPVLMRDLPVLRANVVPDVSTFASDRPRDLAQAIVAWLERDTAVEYANAKPLLRTWRDVATDLVSALGLSLASDDAIASLP